MLDTQTINGVAGLPAASQAALAWPVYDIEIVREPALARDRLEAAQTEGLATAFQSANWITAWYATVGAAQRVDPLLVFVTERETGRPVLTVPLVRHRSGGLAVIAFADLGITDNNAPILGPAAPATPEASRALWASIVKALPKADLIELRKMPATVGTRPNPLALLRGVHPAHSPGFSVRLPDDWETYLRSLSKKFRKELGRSFRLFEKESGAAFRQIRDVDAARRVLDVMNAQQRNRLKEVGGRYLLNEDGYHAFYMQLLAEGLCDGTTVLTTLTAGEEIVATLLGVSDSESFAMMRLSHAGSDWMRIGPGRLIIERTMLTLHGRGIRHFDFSIGDYPYKSGFGVTPSPLLDLVSAQSFRGRRNAVRHLVKASVKRALETIGISPVPQAVKERYRRYHTSD